MAIFRVEKTRDFTVMSNYHLQDKCLSLKAVGLLSKILGLPPSWNYTTRGLAAISKDGVDSISSGLRELEKAGYLVRRQLRDERGRITDTEYTVYERPRPLEHPDTGQLDTDSPDTDFPDMVEPATEKPAEYNNKRTSPNSNQKHNDTTIYPSIHQGVKASPPPGEDGMDRMEEEKIYREIVMENIDYHHLSQHYGQERTDEALELILEPILSTRAYIRVAGSDFPQAAVKSRMLKLTAEHVEYVFDCLEQNTTDVRNIKAYMLAALYNAPVTMDSFYRSKVNHDLYGRQRE